MSSKKILIVASDPFYPQFLTERLQQDGFKVCTAQEGYQALGLVEARRPDLVVLDVALPGLDGWEVCRLLRQDRTVPIILVKADAEEADRVRGLEMGADDFLNKPFSLRELVARMRAIFRRIMFERVAHSSQLQIGAVRIDVGARRIYKENQALILTQKEYELLYVLMSQAGQVVTRAELLDKVWGTSWLGDTRTLDVHIRWVRQKIEENPSQPRYVQTVRGIGYRFITRHDSPRGPIDSRSMTGL